MFRALLLSAFIFSASPTYARWEMPDEAECKHDFINREIAVKADGTSEEIWEEQLQILNESGRTQKESVSLYYNENSEKLTVLAAKSISADGKEHPVPLDMIEDKELASNSGGFDQTRQIMVAFPNLRLKDKIYMKCKRVVTKLILPKYFDSGYMYGAPYPIDKYVINVKSALPLFLDVQNPDKLLEVKEDKKGDQFTYQINLLKPIYKRTNETGPTPKKFLTRIFFSTYKDNAKLAADLAVKYQEILNAPLPPLYKEIAEKAKAATNSIDQINIVTSMLAEKVNYLGDWRTVEGQMVPRPFDKVMKTGVGDCKDFSAATVAILRTLGYKANSALVLRSYIFLEPNTDLATLSEYNHAISHVIDPKGKVFWIDPTNLTSMADGVYPDIENRPSLVLDPQNPRLDVIPAIDPDHAVTKHDQTITREGDDGIKAEGSLSMSGESTLSFTGKAMTNSPREIEDYFISSLTGEATILDRKITLPDLSSRIVKPLTITYTYKKDNMTASTTVGKAIPIVTSWPGVLIYAPDDQVGARDLGNRMKIQAKKTLKNIHVKNLDRLKAEVSSPWIDAKRTARIDGNDVIIEDDVKFKKNFIMGDEVQSEEFKKLKKVLKNSFAEIHVIDEATK